MNESRYCPACGVRVPIGAPQGLCPQCLLAAGFESKSLDSHDPAATQATPPQRGFVTPDINDLARRFPQLEILELLGKGGMGAVYKARQRELDRLVAIKILPPEVGADPDFAKRFTREAKALAQLNHPRIVSVFDFGQVDGLYYIVMEYVAGVNLRQAIQSGKFAPAEALTVVTQICDALQFAHDEGVVHRDIKPENILVDQRGRVKIADFGLAKMLQHDPTDLALTGTHQVMGTLRYMAPEQMEGSKLVDHRADIYSLGLVFYELLTGELPIGRFAPPSKKVHIDVRLDEIVLRALEKEPGLRFQHASEVKSEVEHVAGDTSFPPQVSSRSPGSAPSKPKLVPILAALNLFFAVLLMLAASAESPAAPALDPFWERWEQVESVLGYFMAGGIFAASIGMFLWHGWSRKWMVGLCVLGLAELFISVPYLTRVAIPFHFAEVRQQHLAEGGLPGTEDAIAYLSATMLYGGTLLVSLLWLIGNLVYFTRPRVVAAFSPVTNPEGSPLVENSSSQATSRPATKYSRDESFFYQLGSLIAVLRRKVWFTTTLQWLCALVYLLCLIMFFSFASSRETKPEMDGQVAGIYTKFTAGSPDPWMVMDYRPDGFQWSFKLLSTAYLFALLGLAALWLARWAEYHEKGKVHSMNWHYAIWGVMLLVVLLISVVSAPTYSGNESQRPSPESRDTSQLPERTSPPQSL